MLQPGDQAPAWLVEIQESDRDASLAGRIVGLPNPFHDPLALHQAKVIRKRHLEVELLAYRRQTIWYLVGANKHPLLGHNRRECLNEVPEALELEDDPSYSGGARKKLVS